MPIDVPGLVSATDLHATVDGIAEWQLPSGMIPWFPGGHADPWNHVESAMALDLGGRVHESERAYQWLVDIQRPDGAWHQYYLADRVEKEKLDALKFTFKGDEVTIVSNYKGDKEEKRAKLKADNSKTPQTIDFMPTDGEAKGKTYPGIYKLEKGELTIVFVEKGGDVIQVVNIASRAVIEATVVGPGRVRVTPGSLPVSRPAERHSANRR